MALVNFPSSLAITQLNIGLNIPYQIQNVSVYSGRTETITHGGGFWVGSVLFEPVRYEEDIDKSIELENFFSSTEGIANEFDVPISYRTSRGAVDDNTTLNVVSSTVAGAYTTIIFNITNADGTTNNSPNPGIIRRGDYLNITAGSGDSERVRLVRAERDNSGNQLLVTPSIRGVEVGSEIIVTRFNSNGDVLNYPFCRAQRTDSGGGLLSYTAGTLADTRINFREVV